MRVHVVCCFDNNLVVQAAIMAASIARTASRERPITLHAYHIGELTALNPDDIGRELNSPYFEIVPHALSNPFDPTQSVAHTNPSYCLRLAVIDMIRDIDKLIYLDVDLVVKENLSHLADVDIGSAPIAACCDIGMEEARRKPREAKNVMFSSVVLRDYVNTLLAGDSAPYFNSGVLVVDVKKWRELDVSAKCLDFIEKATYILYADQDALNFVLRGNFAPLDPRWNSIPMYAKDAESLSAAAIVHYAGFKPWSPVDLSQIGDEAYWEFAMSTPFGERLRSNLLGTIDWLRDNGMQKIPPAYRRRQWSLRKRLRLGS